MMNSWGGGAGTSVAMPLLLLLLLLFAALGLAGPAGAQGGAQNQGAAAKKIGSKTAAAATAAVAPAATAQARAGDAQLGQAKAVEERCFECHGEQGQGVAQGPESIFARLAGQHPAYMLQQVRHFGARLRQNDSMLLTARVVSEQDLADIVAYFAQLPPMRSGEAAGERAVMSHSPGAVSAAQRAEAARLAQQGDPGRGIAACASCHGERGQGLPGQAAPVLAGQFVRYLEKQLLDFRSGQRREPAGAAQMGPLTQSLSEAEIAALAVHFAAQR